MIDRGTPNAPRRRGERRQPCRKRKPWKPQSTIGRKAKPRAHRQVNSSARRCITSAKASTAHVRPNRPLQSGCRKRAERASSCPRRKRGRPRRRPDRARNGRRRHPDAARSPSRARDRAPRAARSSARDAARLRIPRWRGRRGRQRAGAVRRRAPPLRRRPCRRKARAGDRLLPARRRARVRGSGTDRPRNAPARGVVWTPRRK